MRWTAYACATAAATRDLARQCRSKRAFLFSFFRDTGDRMSDNELSFPGKDSTFSRVQLEAIGQVRVGGAVDAMGVQESQQQAGSSPDSEEQNIYRYVAERNTAGVDVLWKEAHRQFNFTRTISATAPVYSADNMDIGKFAEMANRIMDVATPMVTAVSTSTEDDRILKMLRVTNCSFDIKIY